MSAAIYFSRLTQGIGSLVRETCGSPAVRFDTLFGCLCDASEDAEPNRTAFSFCENLYDLDRSSLVGGNWRDSTEFIAWLDAITQSPSFLSRIDRMDQLEAASYVYQRLDLIRQFLYPHHDAKGSACRFECDYID